MFDDKFSLFGQLSWKIAVICLLIFVVGAFFADPLSWGAGCLLGGAFTIIRLKMMENSVEKSVQMEAKRASRYARAQYIVRYLLSAAVLAAAAILPWLNPISTVLAMISLKLATYIQGVLDKKYRPEEDYPIVEWEDEEEDEDEEWDRWQTYNRKAGKKLRREMKGGVLKREAQSVTPAQPETGDGQLSLFDIEDSQSNTAEDKLTAAIDEQQTGGKDEY